MAAKTKTMEQIRNMLQMRARGISIRAITKQEGIARNTIRTYLRLIESGGYSLGQALALDDSTLGELLFEATPKAPSDGRHLALQERLPGYVEELKRKHVTLGMSNEEGLTLLDSLSNLNNRMQSMESCLESSKVNYKDMDLNYDILVRKLYELCPGILETLGGEI
jgi:hypothetical protein